MATSGPRRHSAAVRRFNAGIVYLVSYLAACSGDGGPAVQGADDEGPLRFFGAGEGPASDAVFSLSAGEARSDHEDPLHGLSVFELRFDARVGGAKVACGETFEGLGRASTRMEFREFRFYVHDVMLITPDGFGEQAVLASDGPFHNGEVALLDFEDGTGACQGDAALNSVVRAGAVAGSYVGVAFRIGVPEALNHLDLDKAVAPLDVSALYWSWTDGYKHLRIDALTDAGRPFDFHLGSTLCERSSAGGPPACRRKNRPLIALIAFDPGRQRVVLDYAQLVATMDLEADIGGCIAGGTPEHCAPMMQRLGIDHGSGTADPHGQEVFRPGEPP